MTVIDARRTTERVLQLLSLRFMMTHPIQTTRRPDVGDSVPLAHGAMSRSGGIP